MSLTNLGAVLLRQMDPETAHRLAIRALQVTPLPAPGGDDPILKTRIAGLEMTNPVGLAAGLDKNGEALEGLSRLGFGAVECGSVTPRAQPGNPKPRLFRLSEDRAVINRMGFNNEGLEPFAARLSARKHAHADRLGVFGANIGANKDAEDRIGDYVTGLTRLWGLSDYFTVNISSPNTPGLRALQTKAALEELLGRIAEARAGLKKGGADYPIFLKVAPDLEEGEVEAIVETVLACGLNGVIVSNTTIARPDTLKSAQKGEGGGLSGAPLLVASTRVLAEFHAAAKGRVALIGAGGIASGADALAKIKAGACAVQLYSALVYGGPGLVVRIKKDLAARLRAEGFASVSDAIGTA